MFIPDVPFFSAAFLGPELSLTLFFRRCLLSRKRKLSELYFATVGSPNSSDAAAPQNDLYRQNETAFLDANDLTKYALSYAISMLTIG